jgi:hypothetical protein
MAIHTPPTPARFAPELDTPGQPAVSERETAALDTMLSPSVNALAVLDHRSRRRAVPAGTALPGHYLAFDDDAGNTHLLPLDAKIIHLGRASTADLRLEHAQVSRRHAIVVRYGRHVRVLDDRSSAGTFVNGMRVIATDLEDGDVIRIGPIAITYVVVR